MIKDSKNKQQVNARDKFILEKSQMGFSPNEILVLLKREGFAAPVRSRIYQIVARGEVKTK